MPILPVPSENLVPIPCVTIKFKDIFNLKSFYETIHDWFMEYGWNSVDSEGKFEKGKDNYETWYFERIGPKGEKEMWWWWRLQKVPSSYYKFHLDIDSHILYILPTEVIKDGKKLKAHKGEIELKIYGYLEFETGQTWAKHPLLKHFRTVFAKRIFKKEIYEDHKLELYREIYALGAFIKRYFKLKSFLPFEEITPFQTPDTYPEWKRE